MVYLVCVRWGMAVADLQSTVPQRAEQGPKELTSAADLPYSPDFCCALIYRQE